VAIDLARRLFLHLRTNENSQLVSSYIQGVFAQLTRDSEGWDGVARVTLESVGEAPDVETATRALSKGLVEDAQKKLAPFGIAVVNTWEEDIEVPDIVALAFDKKQGKLMKRLLGYARDRMSTLTPQELRMTADLIRQINNA